MNYKLTLQYDGTDFHGWQIQDGLRTVQGELTRVLSLLDGRAVLAHGSGRTDAGVHAVGQVASVRLEHEFAPEKLRAAINGNLERDVRVMEADVVSDEFHARYSARGKTYIYRVINSRVVSPFWIRYAHGEARSLDVERMRECAGLFLGEHDWTAFSSAQTDAASRVREVKTLEIHAVWDERARARLVEFEISANGFLRYMVRSIAGALLAVGRGEIAREIIARAIETGTRPHSIVTAPACGLTLLSVRYD
ncbi:MAG TPA: tRNA pseudouridine(38-40) synthase TruA [Pyrinomonadaceae bacterium]|jgi:tRNA pseudouridine38-40 synthase